jgi:type II secretion system protein H
MGRQRAFTLLEILMVIMIMGILVAITLPRMSGTFGIARLKSTARDLTGILRYARNTAVLREQPCEIRFDMDKGQYQLVLLDASGDIYEERHSTRRSRRREEDATANVMGDDVAGVRQLPNRVFFTVIYTDAPLTDDTHRPRVIYYPDGSATPATIAIEDDKKHAISVEVFRTTGMARVSQGLPKQEPKAKMRYMGPKK